VTDTVSRPSPSRLRAIHPEPHRTPALRRQVILFLFLYLLTLCGGGSTSTSTGGGTIIFKLINIYILYYIIL
jgi:hypothetical protein